MDFKEVRKYLEHYITLNDTEWEAFKCRLQVKRIAKESFILSEGQICQFAVFVLDGAFRFYKAQEGNDLTTAFFFTNDFLSDYQSFLTDRPSLYHIQAIRQSEVCFITKADLHQLYDEFKTFEKLGRLFAERLFLIINKRLDSFLYETPEQRYTELVQRNSKLLQEVPQYMIASYLGITPESLSRIRKRK